MMRCEARWEGTNVVRGGETEKRDKRLKEPQRAQRPSDNRSETLHRGQTAIHSVGVPEQTTDRRTDVHRNERTDRSNQNTLWWPATQAYALFLSLPFSSSFPFFFSFPPLLFSPSSLWFALLVHSRPLPYTGLSPLSFSKPLASSLPLFLFSSSLLVSFLALPDPFALYIFSLFPFFFHEWVKLYLFLALFARFFPRLSISTLSFAGTRSYHSFIGGYIL